MNIQQYVWLSLACYIHKSNEMEQKYYVLKFEWNETDLLADI